MGRDQSKNWISTGLLLLFLGFGLFASTPGGRVDKPATRRPARVAEPHAAPLAGFGGVLVPKRVKMIIRFVQTLPA